LFLSNFYLILRKNFLLYANTNSIMFNSWIIWTVSSFGPKDFVGVLAFSLGGSMSFLFDFSSVLRKYLLVSG
jgi:hypothetical protein